MMAKVSGLWAQALDPATATAAATTDSAPLLSQQVFGVSRCPSCGAHEAVQSRKGLRCAYCRTFRENASTRHVTEQQLCGVEFTYEVLTWY